ncbi:MAG TPA: pseudouridine synthase [Hydrogenophaga sp.]|uniref:pseudouridine synthase n=1 Tax=Hydrogenophaga sp. TaxID=1904254 RepID=UPI002C2EF3F3|nr:pseudouridine synthase [Hydrogenophaga sp.]HMN94472.1 pseudouridine synthase [Hydrogenophaga sp.]HMP11158.1 pseudouridine synthase [Hydrogenophaga sp.]
MSRPPRSSRIPTRQGVSPSCVALPQPPAGTVPWPAVLDFLCERLPKLDRHQWKLRMAQGDVVDEAGQPVPPQAPYRGGSRLYYWREVDEEPRVPFEARVLFQDGHLLVADKPHFLPVTPGGRFVQQTLLVRLKQATGIEGLSPVHRIDRETAGLVVFSVRPEDRGAYQALFRERQVHKLYEAIAPAPTTWPAPIKRRSCIEEDPLAFYRMVETDGEPNSETTIHLVEQQGGWGRFRLEPVTGKRHQLRVHMNALGLPIEGDQFYPSVRRRPEEPEDYAHPLKLLAQALAFRDPVTGVHRRFETGRGLDWPGPV